MKSNNRGFSLIELLLGVSITLVIAMIAFQALSYNDRTFRDDNLIAAMQQNVRAIAGQVEDELRMAGQNSPVYGGRFDTAPLEACQAILNGSSGTQIVFRSGVSNVTSRATAPLTYGVGTPATITVANAAPFSTAIGGASGRFVYVYGKTPNLWGWVRAEVTAVNVATNTITATPAQNGTTGSTFASPMVVSLEEAISYRLSGNSLMRGTVANFTNLTAPTMAETTMGDNFTSVQFGYFDGAGAAITPDTLANRAQVRRVDITFVGRAARKLSDGTQPTFAITVRALPRNLGLE
jgi:prepilin-type N-terminal cleavage/methylation domain-containing protein